MRQERAHQVLRKRSAKSTFRTIASLFLFAALEKNTQPDAPNSSYSLICGKKKGRAAVIPGSIVAQNEMLRRQAVFGKLVFG